MSGTPTPSRSKELLLSCEACGTRVPTLRRGRCHVCYLRWTEARPVGLGAACVVCGERRHDNLRSVEFQRSWMPMCHNCATKTFRMQPIPRTVEAIRQTLSRDRRWMERRVGRKDNRLFPSERRADERREGESPLRASDFLDATDWVVELAANAEGGRDDATRIAIEDEKKADTQQTPPPVEATGPHRPTVIICDDIQAEEILVD